MIFDLLKDFNMDDSFTEKINESLYIEKINNQSINNQSIGNKYYLNFVSCIISEYDTLYSTIPENEKTMYMKKRIMEICSEMEEKSDLKYHNYQFNELLNQKCKNFKVISVENLDHEIEDEIIIFECILKKNTTYQNLIDEMDKVLKPKNLNLLVGENYIED